MKVVNEGRKYYFSDGKYIHFQGHNQKKMTFSIICSLITYEECVYQYVCAGIELDCEFDGIFSSFLD